MFQTVRCYPFDSGTDQHFDRVVLLMGFEGANGSTAMVDESQSAHPMTANGSATISTAQAKFGTSSLRLTGSTSDFVSAPDSDDWRFTDGTITGSASFTVECFLRFNTAPSATTLGIVSQASTGTATSSWYLAWHATPAGLRFANFATSFQFNSEVTQALTTGQWYHIAVTRDGGSAVRIFLDGVMILKTSENHNGNNSSEPLRIGKGLSNTASFDGWMDEIRITSGICRYGSDSGFTPPTRAFPRS